MATKVINVRIDIGYCNKLVQLAKAENRNLSNMAETILKKYIDEN